MQLEGYIPGLWTREAAHDPLGITTKVVWTNGDLVQGLWTMVERGDMKMVKRRTTALSPITQ